MLGEPVIDKSGEFIDGESQSVVHLQTIVMIIARALRTLLEDNPRKGEFKLKRKSLERILILCEKTIGTAMTSPVVYPTKKKNYEQMINSREYLDKLVEIDFMDDTELESDDTPEMVARKLFLRKRRMNEWELKNLFDKVEIDTKIG